MVGRTPISAGNWKMHGTAAEAAALCEGLAGIGAIQGVEVVLAPSFLQLGAVAAHFAGTGVGVAGQNMHAEESGAYTGEVGVTQLREVTGWVLLGHSERRQFFCEDDEALNKKLGSALAHGLRPILCVGEQLHEREAGRTEAVLSRQISEALRGNAIPDGFVIAYEPVWAIGTGRAASSEEAQTTIAFVRRRVAEQVGAERAATVRLLYGGSVKPGNVAELIAEPDIDGALVGGAALDAEAFLAITRTIAASSG